MDVERIIEELYRLNPGEFVAARDAYVAEARKAGDASAAKAIAALRRPTRATWAANLLAHERREEAGQLVELGRTLREAHRTLDAPQLRAAGHQRHQLVAALAREAAGLARAAGLPIGDTVVHEVEQILHTLLADPEVAERWSHGRLTAVPEAVVGFMGVPAPSVPSPPSSSRRARKEAPVPPEAGERGPDRAQERRRERLERARTAAAQADAEARRREEGLREARDGERAAEAAATEAAERVRALERELHEAHRAERASRTVLTEAASAAKEAERAAREARRAAERAARSVGNLETRDEEP
ncbi:hypothetical protein [Streptomyces lateritius]|uniref:hypothetical protein n=1 Tax=Streptomyces lateritius TaxID=67313 RepID=UPI001676D370|nr:hypothetical protein [Streptomyces lateritius]